MSSDLDSRTPVDFLQGDTNLISGQKYALISVVSPDGNQKNKSCAVKIKAVFETVEEAQISAKKMQAADPLFDIYLVEMGKWLPIPPNNDMIESQEYQDNLLNEIIHAHVNEKERAKQFFEERKHELESGKADPSEATTFNM